MLIVTDGPARTQKLSLAGIRLAMIGRDAACTFQIIDPTLSRQHLQLRLDEEQRRHFAIDFTSSNGVFINGRRISQETPLADGDVITLGNSSLVYCTSDDADAQAAYDAWKKIGQAHQRTIPAE
jgi:pSer/pThr/pTyr-binding forkhead associated (FHA) protein